MSDERDDNFPAPGIREQEDFSSPQVSLFFPNGIGTCSTFILITSITIHTYTAAEKAVICAVIRIPDLPIERSRLFV